MKITGYLKIDSKDSNNNIIDHYEGKNTIMDTGRIDVMNWLHGLTNNTSSIDRFVLGTGGYDGTAAPAVFPSTRTNTFSEANGDEFYTLDFTTDPSTLATTVTAEEGAPAVNSVVTVTQDNSAFTVTYRFEIPQTNANGSGIRQYNEAAMYCNGAPDAIQRLFSMRTYNIRSKDSTVSFDIEWTISFG